MTFLKNLCPNSKMKELKFYICKRTIKREIKVICFVRKQKKEKDIWIDNEIDREREREIDGL